MPDADQLARLNALKLTALVRDHGIDVDGSTPGEFSLGAAMTTADGTAWVLADQQPARSLGPALAWTLRHQAKELHLLVPSASGLLARRAQHLRAPRNGTIHVWHVDGRTLLPAIAEPLIPEPAAPEQHLALVDLIIAGGATPNVEHGVVAGEVRGLEVCRVVDDPHTGATRLEVGVGAHDREAFQLLHGDKPTVEALAGIVAAVVAQRVDGAPIHPLNRLAGERLLRARLVDQPSIIGASSVRAVAPPVARTNVKDSVACAALAVIDGTDVACAMSSGVDLDLVPTAVDVRLMHGAMDGAMDGATHATDGAIVAPARDLLPIQRELAALAVPPLRVIAVG